VFDLPRKPKLNFLKKEGWKDDSIFDFFFVNRSGEKSKISKNTGFFKGFSQTNIGSKNSTTKKLTFSWGKK